MQVPEIELTRRMIIEQSNFEDDPATLEIMQEIFDGPEMRIRSEVEFKVDQILKAIEDETTQIEAKDESDS